MSAFTTEKIRLLAECERMMDGGEIPFVILNGQRASMSRSAMEYFGLEQGQTITGDIFVAVLQFKCAEIEAEIIERKLAKDSGGSGA